MRNMPKGGRTPDDALSCVRLAADDIVAAVAGLARQPGTAGGNVGRHVK